MAASDIPTDLPPASPEPIEPGRPRRNRLLIGCLTAAGVLVALILVGVISFVTWIRKPGPSLDPAVLVDRNTVLYAELHLRPGDEAIRDFLLRATETTKEQVEQGAEDSPAPYAWFMGGSPEGPTTSDIEKTLPVVAMVTRQESGEGLISRALMAVNVPKLGNRMRFVAWFFTLFMGWAEEGQVVSEYRGEKIVRLDEDGEPLELSVVNASLLVSREQERIRWAIDRIREAEEAGSPSGLTPDLLAPRPDDALLFISARGGFADQVVRLVRRGAPEFASALQPMMEGAGPVTIRADLTSPDALVGEIRVAAGSPDEEEQDEYAGSVTAVLPAGELTMSLEPLPRGPGERHAWRMEIRGLEEVAFRSLELFDVDPSRPESVPEISVEPEEEESGGG